jgi:hypothetical protein
MGDGFIITVMRATIILFFFTALTGCGSNSDPYLTLKYPKVGVKLSSAHDVNPNKAGLQIDVRLETSNVDNGALVTLTNSRVVDSDGSPTPVTAAVQTDGSVGLVIFRDYTVPQRKSTLQLALSNYNSQMPCDGTNCIETRLNPLADYWDVELPSSEIHPNLFYDGSSRAKLSKRIKQEPWSVWWISGGHQHWTGAQEYDAINWWFTGDIAKAKKAREYLLNTPISREPKHGYLEPSSHYLSNFVVAYDVLAAWDGLSAADRTVIRDKIAAEADHYYSALSSTPGGGKHYGNQRTLAASALGLAALTLCEYENRNKVGPKQWLALALNEIYRNENLDLITDGGLFVEGVGYSKYMAVQLMQFAIAYERATGKYIMLDPRLQEWLRFIAYQTNGAGINIPWGTMGTNIGLEFLGLLVNSHYGGDLAPLFKAAFNQRYGKKYVHSFNNHIAIALYDPAIPDLAPSASWAFQQSQTVVLRKNWGSEQGVSIWFAGKGDNWPTKYYNKLSDYYYDTYSHGDSGSFVLSAWDEILATDSDTSGDVLADELSRRLNKARCYRVKDTHEHHA